MESIITDTRIPEAVIPILEKHAAILRNALSGKLIGIYVHGSAAMGGFKWEQSDIDYIAVVSGPLGNDERRELADSFLSVFGDDTPANGVEMSIVLEQFAGRGFRYPTPYEFHFGTKEQIRLHASPHEVEMVDPDLAAHFTIIKRRGICIFGKPIDNVFAEVSRNYYLASIIADSEESFRNIQSKTPNGMCRVPVYAVLNFCRVVAFAKAGRILSKFEAISYATENFPTKYHPIILAAGDEYTASYASDVDGDLLREFSTLARERYFSSKP